MRDPAGQLPAIVDPRHTAVMVIDVQNCFCDFEMIPAAEAMLPRLSAFIETARRFAVPLIFTQVVQTDETDTEVWQSLYERSPGFRNMCRPGSHGADYHPRFRPEPDDTALVKHRYSAFIGTPLEMMLRARGVKTVVLTGLTTDCCVGSTARDAFQRDFHAVMVEDCTADATETAQKAALDTHRDDFGLVASSQEIERAWESLRADR
jgi:ureidoacrylate peracid hydrolase